MIGTLQAMEKIKLGVMNGAEEEIANVVKSVAINKGLNIELISFSDYTLPNEALENGELDANAFQHNQYLNTQIKTHGYHIVAIGFTIIEPLGLYSKKIKTLDMIPVGAKIAIPNDPSNAERALNLLVDSGLIKIQNRNSNPSIFDIVDNPKKIKFIELDSALLSRSLIDLDAAMINTNHAITGGLDLYKDTIIRESCNDNPYGNIIAVREIDRNKPVFKTLIEIYKSPEVTNFLKIRFKGAILPIM
ncbi:MAG: MetQ/NlpA family ABC transporter substrate-binding protein [Rhodospirillaceae bacterium]|jgi:D-methionine transport system substrate-binding protein|nr:MetQ/NlpA family ABC transporter substrate-binding protein [Rhodospirillaceae bacterium]